MCTERYINPFTDFGFKRMFGSEKNKAYLINFLNSLFGEKDKIVDLTYANTEQLGILPGDRNAIFDLYCTTENHQRIIVEMQNSSQKHFIDRAVYYTTLPIQNAAQPGEWNYELPRVYMVAFLNFTMSDYATNPNFKHTVKLFDEDTETVFYNKLVYYFLEMPKFVKDFDDLEDRKEYWLYIIKNINKLDGIPEKLNDDLFRSFFNLAEVSNLSKEEYQAYEMSLKRMRDSQNIVNTAREEGKEEGIAIGEHNALSKTARNMKALGIPVSDIAKCTGLPEADINAL